MLISVLYDGKVMWYEALILVSAYFLYTCLMYFNDSISRKVRQFVSKYWKRYKIRPFMDVNEASPLITKEISNLESNIPEEKFKDLIYITASPWNRDEDNFMVFLMRWPITFLLWATIPDCRKNTKLSLLTFVLCIFWIGVTSYLVAFLITIVGRFNLCDCLLHVV